MRDVVNITSHIKYWDESRDMWYHNGVAQGPWTEWKPATWPGKSWTITRESSGRADVTRSDHVQPTPYNAWKTSITPANVGGIWADNGPQPTGQAGWHRRRQFRVTGLWAHFPITGAYTGLTGVIPYESQLATVRAEAQVSAKVADAQISLSQNLGEMFLTYGAMKDNVRRGTLALVALARGDVRSMLRHLGIMWDEDYINRRLRPRHSALLDGTDIRLRIHERPSYIQDWHAFIADAPDLLNDYILAYKFGWQPLMQDLANQRQALMSFLEPEDGILKAEGVGIERTNASLLANVDEGIIEYITHIRVQYKISDEFKSGLQKLGAMNPFALAWELMSYSFVVDWFTGMGDFLNSLDAYAGTELLSCSKTVVAKATVSLWPDDPVLREYITERGSIESFGMQRQVLSHFPIPSPRIRLGLDSGPKLVTLFQLLNQRVR